jgi:hypothetical protein
MPSDIKGWLIAGVFAFAVYWAYTRYVASHV